MKADGGLPLHLSLVSLRRHPVVVPRGSTVLVVENPQVLDAAIERDASLALVCANGRPSTAVTTLLRQLLDAGAAVGYHGDFDAPGIAMCRRMAETGCAPRWMGAADYLAAVERARHAGIPLEHDTGDCGDTPWDPDLRTAFDAARAVIHEEYVIDQILRAPPS